MDEKWKRLVMIAGGALLAVALTVWAAEQDEPAADDRKSDDRSADVFVPSEAISEDFPAPFPVDI